MYKKEIEQLEKEFKRIKNMGYVKSTRNGPTGIGKTFEDLLGKKEDALGLPDYKGIEIKTKRSYSNSYTTLFNATLHGQNNYETKRLCSCYGYPDKIIKDKKVLNVSFSVKPTLIANRFFFNLKVDHEAKKIYVIIKDRWNNLLENTVYWDFEDLKERLYTKMKYLALINAWPTTRNGEIYYRYDKISFYKLKSFEKFIELIEKGIIRVSIKMGVIRSGEKKGMSHDRGTSFELKSLDFPLLFDHIQVYN